MIFKKHVNLVKLSSVSMNPDFPSYLPPRWNWASTSAGSKKDD
jgi:hypothetical protein